MQQIMQPTETDPVLEQIAPLLDQAMAQLHEPDCNALLLRYFQNKNLREVGAALGLSEDAAQKRISRAVLKLRGILARHGAPLSAALVAGALETQAAQAAVPAQLSVIVTAAGLGASALSPSIRVLVKETLSRLFWPKIQAATAIVLTPLCLTLAFVLPRANRPALNTVAADSGNMKSAFQGTPGLKYEPILTGAGQTQTKSGVSPEAVSLGMDAFTEYLASVADAKVLTPGAGYKAASGKGYPALQPGPPILSFQAAKNNSLINSRPAVHTNFALRKYPAPGSTNPALDTNAVSVVDGGNPVIISPTTNRMFSRLPDRAQPAIQHGSQPTTQNANSHR
jgi:hypothetical protein